MSSSHSTHKQIRGYELRERIGAGGFGEVYRAHQAAVDREVAIKVILPEYANHPDFIRSFESEARLIARLEHPYIVPLYDYWREPDGAYLVMRWLPGGNLRQSILEERWDPGRASHMLDQIASALVIAHNRGVVHRDLKPENILLDEGGNAYLSDFGVAKDLFQSTHLTETGVLKGSFAFISPEQVQGSAISPQSDLYSLGIVMYEVLTGKHPFPDDTPAAQLFKHISEPLPPIYELRSDLPEKLNSVIQTVTAKKPSERYSDALAFAAAFRSALDGTRVEVTTPEIIRVTVKPENPYKGLRAFEEADADDFYGREALTQQLLLRMGEDGNSSRFLAVVGPSGCGKSSLVKAGLLPAIRNGALPESENWYMVEMLPGSRPLDELEIGLLRIAVDKPPDLMEQLRRDEYGLLRAARLILPTPESELLLVVDQFEELFTRATDRGESEHLLQSIYHAVTEERSRVRVVITLRADFYDRPLMHPEFSNLMRQRTEVVVPLTAEELSQVIRKPAERVGITLEPGLVPAIVADVSEQPGALPMLQYALTELFEKRQDNTLTKEAYQAIGGVSRAIAKRAEEVYAGLDEVSQSSTRQVFLRLVTLGEGVEDTRRRVLQNELTSIQMPESAHDGDPLQRVIDRFGSSRLLLFDRDPTTRAPTVEVAHEALLREWGRLREWLDESRADLRMQRVLGNAAEDWQEAQRDPSYLLRGARLTQYEAWLESTDLALNEVERDYLNASLAEQRARQAAEVERQAREVALEQRSRRFLRAFVAVLAVASVVAVVLAIIAFNQRGVAEQNALLAGQSAATATVAQGFAQIEAATAQAERLRAEDESNARATQQALAEAEAQARATAQANAEIQQSKAEQLTRLALSRELAAAALNNLDVDPERSVLLALHALSIAHSQEAENTLHNILPSLHLLKTLDAHLNPICDIAVSQDGKHLATADCGQGEAGGDQAAYRTSGRVKVWDLTSYQELHTLRKERGIKSIDFSPNGERLAVVLTRPFVNFWDDRWMVWNLVSDRVEYTTDRLEEGLDFNSITFNPDGSQVATAGSNFFFGNIAHVWDVPSGKKLLSLTGHLLESIKGRIWLKGVLDIVYSPDGTRLATGGPDGSARIWDATTGEQLLVLTGHVNEVNQVAFSPDGAHLASAGYDGTVRIWDLTPGQNEGVQMNLIPLEEPVWTVAYHPDGTRLATGSVDGVARIWDVDSGQLLLSLPGHTGSISALAFTPDGTRLITASDDTTVNIWDVTLGREIFTVTSPHGAIQSASYSPDGSRLVTTEQDGSAHVWDASTFTKMLTLSGHSNPLNRVVFSNDGSRVATASEDQTVIVWDSETGEEMLTITELPASVLDVVFSPDGRLIATATNDGMVRLWDADTGRRLQVLVGHTTEHIHSLAFSPDGSRLVSAGWDGNAILWDLASGQTIDFIGSESPAYGVAFSPDGEILAVSREDGSTTLWDISTEDAKEVAKLIGHESAISRVAFSPDGERIATVDLDGITRIWDVEASVAAPSGVEVLTLTSHSAGVLDVSFSPDGKRLVTSSLDGTARVYTLDLEELVAMARARLTRTLTEEECRQYLHMDSCPELP